MTIFNSDVARKEHLFNVLQVFHHFWREADFKKMNGTHNPPITVLENLLIYFKAQIFYFCTHTHNCSLHFLVITEYTQQG